ncbi:hypothetical protein DFJ77DRAFT_542197 [Powellomyces hirtus]|nr:hypothetical protein DFJ77DRAFT_542197 [Powellomyces hirtus]
MESKRRRNVAVQTWGWVFQSRGVETNALGLHRGIENVCHCSERNAAWDRSLLSPALFVSMDFSNNISRLLLCCRWPAWGLASGAEAGLHPQVFFHCFVRTKLPLLLLQTLLRRPPMLKSSKKKKRKDRSAPKAPKAKRRTAEEVEEPTTEGRRMASAPCPASHAAIVCGNLTLPRSPRRLGWRVARQLKGQRFVRPACSSMCRGSYFGYSKYPNQFWGLVIFPIAAFLCALRVDVIIILTDDLEVTILTAAPIRRMFGRDARSALVAQSVTRRERIGRPYAGC